MKDGIAKMKTVQLTVEQEQLILTAIHESINEEIRKDKPDPTKIGKLTIAYRTIELTRQDAPA